MISRELLNDIGTMVNFVYVTSGPESINDKVVTDILEVVKMFGDNNFTVEQMRQYLDENVELLKNPFVLSNPDVAEQLHKEVAIGYIIGSLEPERISSLFENSKNMSSHDMLMLKQLLLSTFVGGSNESLQ